jgi:integrase
MPTNGGIMASVLPRRMADGRVSWRVQFRVGPAMRSKSFEHEAGARQFGQLIDRVGAAAALAVWEARQSASAGTPTLREWIDEYLEPSSGRLTGIEKGTRAGYRSIADRSLIPILGDIPIDVITKADVGRWVAWQEGQMSARRTNGKAVAISPKTVKNYHALLSSILAAAVDANLRTDNPAFRTRLTRGRKREGVFLSRQEFATLVNFIPAYYVPLVQFLAGTGTRWGEATAATWGDVELSTRTPTVRIDKAWKKGTNGTPVLGPPKSERSRRTISLWPELVSALGSPRPGDELLFPGAMAGRQIWYGAFNTRIWKKAVAKANDRELIAEVNKTRGADEQLVAIGKQPNIHDLRHTHASWLIHAGAPLPFVQARLGHEKITTTVDTYGHLLPDAHEQMAQMMSDTMSNVLPPIVLGELETVGELEGAGLASS